ncbi:geranylgeranyl pyrophosphate synthase [Aequorivita sublithincola DSM 14238]|uniref:Geranylgeranyl pyrophosphate synthase n=1 Tax=Aequorivita sublithincola (strain DSM 14238 / LMG 21431 / ACAM 643 / 9-3) TaxID=746697 RepID=I3YVA8_AEQSU|nr:polyprenyl synthetase family protein [Aequorivita sublithincola]AFL80926.1 geranylgeranyl pyrophosphate synthase [Aequorivita sublithincola DSM 14238]
MDFLKKYNVELHQYLEKAVAQKEPNQLYDPIKYILSLGGKRIRPKLTLMICDFFGTDFKKAMNAALAVELFHNFSLIHDDIMDNAPLRRGKVTVHEKWDVNTAILSGDAMLILAYQFFESYEPKMFQELAKLFSETALQVCEGQQHDMDFETRDDVILGEYINMIGQKTAVLLGAAMKMGAIVAEASKRDKEIIYLFGENLGIAFQLQDDYLDVFGNPETFGKQVGGDIISNKKTILYILAINSSTQAQAEELEHLFSISPKDATDKIATVKEIFIASGAANATQSKIEEYSNFAYALLDEITISEEKKQLLRNFGNDLMQRNV